MRTLYSLVSPAVAALLLVATQDARAFSVLEERLHISGYGNGHYMKHSGVARTVGGPDLNDGQFQLREFSLFLDARVADGVLASVEIEAADNATKFGANYAYVDVDLEEATGAWNAERFGSLSVRMGKILVPFLAYNENKANFRQYLMSQPFTAWNLSPVVGVPVKFSGFGWSDVGVMLGWQYDWAGVGIIDLKATVINGIGSDSYVLDGNFVQIAGGPNPYVVPRDGLIQNEGGERLTDNNDDKATVVKLSFRSEALPLEAGFSWYRGEWDPSSTQNLHMIGVHAAYAARNWSLRGEWVRAFVEQTAGIDPVADAGLMGPAPINTSTGDYTMQAWYVEGSVVVLRYGEGEKRYIRLVARFDDVDTNDKAAFTPFDRNRVTVGGEWEFATDVRLRYEYQYQTLDDFSAAPAPYAAAGGKEHIHMNMASAIFSF